MAEHPALAEPPGSGASAPLLTVRGLTVRYGSVTAVHDLDLDVAPTVAHVPPGMVRDVGLPPFCRPRPNPVPRVAESR